MKRDVEKLRGLLEVLPGRDEGLNAGIRYHRLRDFRCAAKMTEMWFLCYYFGPLLAVTECKRDGIKVQKPHPRRLVVGVWMQPS